MRISSFFDKSAKIRPCKFLFYFSTCINPHEVFVEVFFRTVSVLKTTILLFNTLNYKQGQIILISWHIFSNFAKICFYSPSIILDVNISCLATVNLLSSNPSTRNYYNFTFRDNKSMQNVKFASAKIKPRKN